MPPTDNPYESKPKFERLRPRLAVLAGLAVRAVLAPPKLLLDVLYRNRSRRGRLLVALGLLVGLSAAGWQVSRYFQRRAARLEVVAASQAFEKAANSTADPAELRAALERLLAARPDDAVTAARLAALESGESPADDPDMTHVLMRVHAQAGRTPEAAREAQKRLAVDPTDRLARCLVAEAALRRNDRAAAEEHLAAIARPDLSPPRDTPFALVLSVSILEAAGRRTGPLRQHIGSVVLPALRTEAAASASAATQVTLLRCYAVALTAPELPGGAAGYWAPAGRLAELALAAATEAGDAKLASQLGEAGGLLAVGLNRLTAGGQIPAADRPALSAELEDRVRRAWRLVRAKAPDDPAAYSGLALSFDRSGEYAAALAALEEGLTACPDHPRLVELYVRGWQSARPERGLDRAWAAAERHPAEPDRWALAARAARAAGRRDKALEAVAAVRRLDPNRPEAAGLEAALWAEAGRPGRALEAFAARPDADWAADPATARPLAQALAAANLPDRLDAALAVSTETSAAAGTAAAEGVLDAAPAGPFLEKAAIAAAAVLTQWPGHGAAARARALALFRQLDAAPPPWPEERVKAAEEAAEVGVRAVPTDPELAAALGWVRLRGKGQPAGALTAVRPLLGAEALAAFPAEAAGAALLANARPAEAVRLLERARGRYDVSAGLLVQLARAYRATGRPADAEAALREASVRPMTARERADFRAAAEGR